jgi:hypothetical protein
MRLNLRPFALLSFGLLFQFQLFAMTPVREVSVIVTNEGYYPKSLALFEGEKVRLFVTSTLDAPNCLIVESHKVFLAANKGKVTEAEVIFDKAGEFSFYCPGSKNDGKIVVMKKLIPTREIASEKKAEDKMIWMPREY